MRHVYYQFSAVLAQLLSDEGVVDLFLAEDLVVISVVKHGVVFEAVLCGLS